MPIDKALYLKVCFSVNSHFPINKKKNKVCNVCSFICSGDYSDNSKKYVNWIEIRSGFFCE
jgi:hypothetical protein